MDPDELYTLRAQYWLGHYSLCLDEGKSLARRPMPPNLKEEREEFVLRSCLALGQYDRVAREATNDKPVALRALGLRAKYESTKADDDEGRSNIINTLQILLNDPETANSSSLQLTAAQVFLAHGDMTREALQCVHLGTTMEHLATSVQIYIRMDRLDLAEEQLNLMKQADEDAVLTQLCTAYLGVATGSTRADDAAYVMSTLSEQYGPSPFLLNIAAVAQMVAGEYDKAESSLKEALSDDPTNVDALANLCVCYQYLGKSKDQDDVLRRLRQGHPNHFYLKGLVRVEGAMDREAVKYTPKQ